MVKVLIASFDENDILSRLASEIGDFELFDIEKEIPFVKTSETALFHVFGASQRPDIAYNLFSEAQECGYYNLWTPCFYNHYNLEMAYHDLGVWSETFFVNNFWAKIFDFVDVLAPYSYYEVGCLSGKFGIPSQVKVATPIPLFIPPISQDIPEGAIGLWNSWKIEEGLDLFFKPGGIIYQCEFDQVEIRLINLPLDEEDELSKQYQKILRDQISKVSRKTAITEKNVSSYEDGIKELQKCKIFLDLSYEVPNPLKHLTMRLGGREVIASYLGSVPEALGPEARYISPLIKNEVLQHLLAAWKEPYTGTKVEETELTKINKTVLQHWLELYSAFSTTEENDENA